MGLPNYFISCDWGTTNFRLRLVETDTLRVLAECKTDQGIRSLYEKYLTRENANQEEFFSEYLKEQIQKLPDEHQGHLVVSAGMASSNIGLHELEYAEFPLQHNGSSLVWKYLTFENGVQLLLISGVKSDTGMMRGEEIQAIGLADQLKSYNSGILLLPGTHSKHISFRKGEFTGLKNYMTGELFEVLSKRSILANSVSTSEWTEHRKGAFKEGLDLGFEGKLSENLFTIRAKHIIGNSKKEDNYYTLSGMLIGDELSYLKNSKDNIILAAPESVLDLYGLALKTLLDADRFTILDVQMLENALFVGQRKILTLHAK